MPQIASEILMYQMSGVKTSRALPLKLKTRSVFGSRRAQHEAHTATSQFVPRPQAPQTLQNSAHLSSHRASRCRTMHSTLTCLLLAAAGASGLQLAAAPSSLHRPQLVRHGAPCMQESPEPPPSQQLSDETLRKAAETASEPSAAWPTPEVASQGSNPGVADPGLAGMPQWARRPGRSGSATHTLAPCLGQPQRAAINEPASYAAGGGVVPEASDEL